MISQGAISSQLTTWGKNRFLLSKLLQRGSRTTPEHSSPDCELHGAASAEKALRREAPLEFYSRSTLEQISHWEIMLLEEILRRNP
jgi:hypothetical protein